MYPDFIPDQNFNKSVHFFMNYYCSIEKNKELIITNYYSNVYTCNLLRDKNNQSLLDLQIINTKNLDETVRNSLDKKIDEVTKAEKILLVVDDDKEGKIIGFTLPLSATFNGLDGKYLGRLNPNGNIVKGKTIIGKVGVAGQAIDDKGKIIGLYNHVAPLFDYLGQLQANATINGMVLSLEGNEVGYMQNDRAFDHKEKEIGKPLENYLAFDMSNDFIGISGIDSSINYKGEKYTISPYGYIFNEKGAIDGAGYRLSSVYASDGNVLANISSNGRLDNLSMNDHGKLLSSGYFLNNDNKTLVDLYKEIYGGGMYNA